MSTRAYPVRHPDGDDPRFNHGLIFDIGKVLESHGFPPVKNGTDVVDLMMALFGFVYPSEGRPVPAATPAQLSMMQRAEIHADLKDDRLCDLAGRAVHAAVKP